MAKTVYSEASKALAASLAEARRGAGLHQEQLAERLGKDQSVISNIERGQRRVDVLELYAIARALGIEPSDLFARVTADFPPIIAV